MYKEVMKCLLVRGYSPEYIKQKIPMDTIVLYTMLCTEPVSMAVDFALAELGIPPVERRKPNE